MLEFSKQEEIVRIVHLHHAYITSKVEQSESDLGHEDANLIFNTCLSSLSYVYSCLLINTIGTFVIFIDTVRLSGKSVPISSSTRGCLLSAFILIL